MDGGKGTDAHDIRGVLDPMLSVRFLSQIAINIYLTSPYEKKVYWLQDLPPVISTSQLLDSGSNQGPGHRGIND